MAEEPRDKDELYRDILLYKVNFFVGCICMITVIINLSILLITKKFRTQFMVSFFEVFYFHGKISYVLCVKK